jgi:NitT/TauT family transport system substrate-binding protein
LEVLAMTDPQTSLSRRQLLQRTAVGAGLLTAGGGLLAACGSDDKPGKKASAGSAAKVSNKPIVLAWGGAACEAPLYAAYHNGFFKDEGLNIKLQQVGGDALHDAVSTGKVAGGPGILFQWLKPIEQGLNVKLTSGLHEGCLRFVTPKDSGITSLSQAKGKTIVTDEINGSAMAFFSVDLANAGINPEKDVTWKQVPFDQVAKSLSKGVGQIAAAPDPAAYFPLEDGSALEIGTNLGGKHAGEYCCVTALNGDLIKKDPATAAAIVRAWARGSTWVGQNLPAAAQIEIDNKYVAAPKKLLVKLLSQYTWNPGSQDLGAQLEKGAIAFKGTGYLDSGTDPKALAKLAYAELPGVV